MNKLIKRRFKYAFGTTLVTSSLLLMSHGHAFAVTNNIDQAFNHDNNGQPITSQDSNNNVDPGFNHDVDDNNDTDPGFNHDVIHNNDPAKHQAEDNDMGFNGYAEQNGLVKQTSKSNSQQDPAKHQAEDNDMGFNGYVEQNGLVKQTSKSNSQQDPTKHQAEDNDMGFNGYAEQNGLVKQTSKSNSQQDPTKHQAEDNDMGFNGYAEKHHLVKQQDQSPKSQMNSTLSKQATRSQETSQTSLHHELPMTGERASTTTFVYSFIAFILGVGVISLRRKFSK
ncbi:LPXTG cell wall anchor domain-containing protein [Staphylococcus haemolyticus]|uniref:LPXTG cell wall anchor domain-containing protein n=1 Tax=Staphylococcus haemolyticus TaxID=1283 RepID=UPI0021B69544|nr:LPXTG cell wall anchor domain-containing protein [Staphylococcus haemolyticus]